MRKGQISGTERERFIQSVPKRLLHSFNFRVLHNFNNFLLVLLLPFSVQSHYEVQHRSSVLLLQLCVLPLEGREKPLMQIQ